MNETPPHQITRIRRDTRRRQLTVAGVEALGSAMRRIWLAGDDLHDFESAAPDDHVKLFLPGPDGAAVARDYTPRLFDAAARTLAIDFALHGEGEGVGPATRWAMEAAPGDVLEVGGPRGSVVVADDFDWYLLIGDEAAIPAIARRVEELRADVPVSAVISILSGRERPPLPNRPELTLRWAKRTAEADGGETLLAQVAGMALPPGGGFVWIAAEAAAAKAVRKAIVDRGQPKGWIKAAGYWLAGEDGVHAKIGDD